MSVVLATAGGMIIDNVVSADGTVSLGAMGGNAAYSAVGAHIWSRPVGVVAAVPSDYPQVWLNRLAEADVDVTGVVRHAEAVRLSEWFFYRPDGSRRDGLYASLEDAGRAGIRDDRLSPEAAGAWEAALSARDHAGLTFGGFRAIHPVGPDQLPPGWTTLRGLHLAPERPDRQLALARLAASRGAVTTLDPGPHVRGFDPATLSAVLATVDAFLPSERELAVLAPGCCPDDAVRRLTADGRSVVCAKLGASGSLVFDGSTGRTVLVPIVPVVARDPTGAGDAFCGGFLAGLVATGDPVVAACFGTVSASFAVEGFGALHALSASPVEAWRRLDAVLGRVGKPSLRKGSETP